MANHSKPWRLPGTDQTDFFNYGFDEYTWTQYCVKQQTMQGQIGELKDADRRMKAMFGGGDGPGQGGGGAGPGGMPGGMPPEMEQMMQQMMAQGLNPGNMDFGQFMGMMGGPGGPMAGGPPGAFPPQQAGGFAGPQQGGPGGFGGSGRQSASPAPQQGGFQPPSGPQAMSMNTEGYSAQQLAIMQNEMGGGGGAGRGGRNRRGRW